MLNIGTNYLLSAHSPSLNAGMGERTLSWMNVNDNDENEVNTESADDKSSVNQTQREDDHLNLKPGESTDMCS